MFVNLALFLVTLSQKNGFQTVEHLPNQQAATLSSFLKKVIKLFAQGGFVVNPILMDQEFDKLESVIENADKNIVNVATNTMILDALGTALTGKFFQKYLIFYREMHLI